MRDSKWESWHCESWETKWSRWSNKISTPTSMFISCTSYHSVKANICTFHLWLYNTNVCWIILCNNSLQCWSSIYSHLVNYPILRRSIYRPLPKSHHYTCERWTMCQWRLTDKAEDLDDKSYLKKMFKHHLVKLPTRWSILTPHFERKLKRVNVNICEDKQPHERRNFKNAHLPKLQRPGKILRRPNEK